MTDPLLGLPTHLRRRLAGALESGALAPPYTPAAVRSALGTSDGVQQLAETLQYLEQAGTPGAATAWWIRKLEEAATRTPIADLVWSGPEVPGLHARDTRRVYQELLGSAERSIWVSTYVYTDGPRAFETLANRMDTTPGLRVTLLLNIQRRQGDTTAADQLVRAFADRFWETDWPGTARPNVCYDPRSLQPDRPAGVLHAKAVVTDEHTVFITSANITDAALDRNIELGLLTQDPALAATITTHFQTLISQQHLQPLPPT